MPRQGELVILAEEPADDPSVPEPERVPPAAPLAEARLCPRCPGEGKAAEADHAAVFALLRQVAPNRRAMERGVLRLRRLPGLVLAGIAGDRLVIVLRNSCAMETRSEGMDVFAEDALIYTRLTVEPGRARMQSWINRARFSLHALERLVERSTCALGSDFLGVVDGEAAALLKRCLAGGMIEHDGDSYLRAKEEGVWAGSLDLTLPEADWGVLTQPEARVPTFSVRTFLEPDEMKPCVWLRWQDDPRLSLAA
ncbi:hypothetical protein [Rhodobacter sp. CZR27]|uniref:hypothetical protein n=1 Tax=Rhodobacter sp. CZR27 TaxID=2033869 RepID=UPI000BBE2F89|nr:hypothetical protein [Rhodobacter sp. CZR27]